MSRTIARAGLGLALAVTLAATGAAWMRERAEDNAALVAALPSLGARTADVPASATGPAPLRARQVAELDDALTLFDPAPWSAPAPTPTHADAAPAAQVALVDVAPGPPPLPFRPLGRFDDSNGPVIFLMHGDQNLVVRRGERFADGYRLEEINGTVVGIRHLATGQMQTLDLGGGS